MTRHGRGNGWRTAGLVVLFGALVACGQREMTFEELQARVESLQKDNDYRTAIIELRDAAQRAPDNAAIRLLLARSLLAMDDAAAARKEFEQALKYGADPGTLAAGRIRALLKLGEYENILALDLPPVDKVGEAAYAEIVALQGHARLALKEYDAAAKLYATALGFDAKCREARLGEARRLHAEGGKDEALAALRALVEDAGDFADAWSQLGNWLWAAKDLDGAERAYTAAISRRARPLEDYLGRTRVRLDRGDLEGAAKDIAEVRTMSPALTTLPFLEGLVLYGKKQYDAASEKFTEALAKNPKHRPTLLFLGVTKLRAEQYESAVAYLSQVADVAPPAARMLAVAYLRQNDVERAKAILNGLLAQVPDDRDAAELLATIEAAEEQGRDKLVQLAAADPDAAGRFDVLLGVLDIREGNYDRAVERLSEAVESASATEAENAFILLIQGHLQQGNAVQAREAAQRFVDRYPESANALNTAGVVHMGEDPEKAQGYFERALQASPGNLAATYNLASLLLSAGKPDEAGDLLRASARKNPTHVRTNMLLARLEVQQGRTEESLQRMHDLIRANPRALEPRLVLAEYQSRKGQYREAIKLLTDNFPENAESPAYLDVLGKAQLSVGDFKAAIDTFTRLIAAVPQSGDAHCRLAGAMLESGDRSTASTHLRKALEVEKGNLCASVLSANVALAEGEPEAAREYLDAIGAQAAKNPAVLVARGDLDSRLGNHVQALASYAEAARQAPNAGLTLKIAGAQVRAGDAAAAVATLDEWLAARPDDQRIALERANLDLVMNKPEDAVVRFRRLVEKYPGNVIALNNLANLLIETDLDAAYEYAQKAAELAPESAPVLDSLGTILLERNSLQQALKVLSKAVSLQPDNPRIKLNYLSAVASTEDRALARTLVAELAPVREQFDEARRRKLEEIAGSLDVDL